MKKNQKTIARPGGKRHRPLGDAERRFLLKFGANLKKTRVQRGMTASELAALIGIGTPPQFNRESGKVSIPLEDLSRYAAALGVKVRDLLPE